MVSRNPNVNERKMTNIFERYLSVWIGLCIIGGILLGQFAPQLAQTLDSMAILPCWRPWCCSSPSKAR